MRQQSGVLDLLEDYEKLGGKKRGTLSEDYGAVERCSLVWDLLQLVIGHRRSRSTIEFIPVLSPPVSMSKC